jgi:hypothetical protein
MSLLSHAVERFRVSGMIYSIDMATGKVGYLTLDEYVAQTPAQLAARRFTFDDEQAQGLSAEIRQRNERTT